MYKISIKWIQEGFKGINAKMTQIAVASEKLDNFFIF